MGCCCGWLKRLWANRSQRGQNVAPVTDSEQLIAQAQAGKRRYRKARIHCCFIRLQRDTVAWRAHQAALAIALDVVFPVCAMATLRQEDLDMNRETISNLRSQTANTLSDHCVIISGSQAEGLSLCPGWGHKIPDLDTMWLFGRHWCVQLDQPGPRRRAAGAYLQMEQGGAEDGYCRIRVVGNVNEMAAKLRKTCVENGPIGSETARQCIVELEGEHWLSSPNVFRALQGLPSDEGNQKSGPAYAQLHGEFESVPALVCSGPIQAVKNFVSRQRVNKNWPKESTLTEISKISTLLVATGHKLSHYSDIEWRVSMSIPELLLASDMQPWVKQGFWVFKYCMSSAIEKERPPAIPNTAYAWGRGTVGSYHFKSILLWELERGSCNDEKPATLLIKLLQRLSNCLLASKLPHYFIPTCDLLACVDEEELKAAKRAVRGVLQDPLSAILQAPEFPSQVFGDEAEDNALLVCLNSLVDSPDGVHVSSSGYHIDRHKEDLIRILARIDEIRERQWQRALTYSDSVPAQTPRTLATLPGQVFPPWGIREQNV